MTELRINSLNRIIDPTPRPNGDKVLAIFNCSIGPVQIEGCKLASRFEKGLTIWQPQCGKQGGLFIEHKTKRELKNMVVEAFAALGVDITSGA